MKKNFFLTLACLIFAAVFAQTMTAQITITLPKIPKIKKDAPKAPSTQSPTAATSDARSNEEQPTGNQTNGNQAGKNDSPEPTDQCENRDGWLTVHLEEIAKRQEEVDSFTPGRGWLVGRSTYNYLLFSVSPSKRQQWIKDSNALDQKECLDAVLDKLALSAAKKIPLYVPNKREYAIQNPATVKLMHSVISEFADHKIFYTGVKEANWLIEKNNYNFPTARYKHGLVWVRFNKNDHPYCRAYYINIIQDYAGGGTYGASYANYVGEDLVACPAK